MKTLLELSTDGWGYTISAFIAGGSGAYFEDGDINKGATALAIASTLALASYGLGRLQKKYEHH